MKVLKASVVTLLLAGTAFAQERPKFQTQAPSESDKSQACAAERKRIAALSELNVSYAEKIDLLEQKIKELEKKRQ